MKAPLEQFLAAIHKLEKRDQDIAKLTYLCGYNPAQIERMTHTPRTTIRRRLAVIPALLQLLMAD